VKTKIERHFERLKEDVWKRNSENGNLHKNLFFGLSYLHAIVDGRRQFGPLGWHINYDFDQTDFDISEQIITSYIQSKEAQTKTLEVVKYIFGQVNFAGKLNRFEDQRRLNAIVEDLFNYDLSFSLQQEMNLEQSHYGFPHRSSDPLLYIQVSLPKENNLKLFGFDQKQKKQ
jgi:hypothetical protein